MIAADTATTRGVGAPTVEAAPAAAPIGGGRADASPAQARGDEQALREQLGRLERAEPTGQPFDPAEQHAVERLPRRHGRPGAEDGPESTARPTSVVVDEVLRPGHRWRGRLVRPAMVRLGTD